jgi:hypothetical protein
MPSIIGYHAEVVAQMTLMRSRYLSEWRTPASPAAPAPRVPAPARDSPIDSLASVE